MITSVARIGGQAIATYSPILPVFSNEAGSNFSSEKPSETSYALEYLSDHAVHVQLDEQALSNQLSTFDMSPLIHSYKHNCLNNIADKYRHVTLRSSYDNDLP